MKSFIIEKAKKIHNNFYTYEYVRFSHSFTKVDINCPLHGIFHQTPHHHINRGQGCPKCRLDKVRKKLAITTQQFIKNSIRVHGTKYDYSLVDYKNCGDLLKIKCPIHGIFEQSGYSHVNVKCGCPKCRGTRISLSKRFTKEKFVERATQSHGNLYDYSLTNYKNMGTKITIICNKHGNIEQTPWNHIQYGCPNCGNNVSKQETGWLDSLNIPIDWRQKVVTVDKIRYKVDAYDKKTKTIYEFFGYFWHGHPDHFNSDSINPRNGKTFGELYSNTLKKVSHLESNGFLVIQKWG